MAKDKTHPFLEFVAFFVVGAVLFIIFFRQIISPDFDLMIGNVGDSRFNGFILEHWFKVIKGDAEWLSPKFFYPKNNTLGYSDAGFLFAIPYVIFRISGVSTFTAYQMVLFLTVILGWAGTIIFLRHFLKLGIIATLIGAILFVFPNSMATIPGHTQLYAIYFIPFFAMGIHQLIKHFYGNKRKFIFSSIFVTFLLSAILYTSFYVGYFLIFYILIFLALTGIWNYILFKEGFLHKVYSKMMENRFKLILIGFFLVLFMIPFLLTYLPVYIEINSGHSYGAVYQSLPEIPDFINVGVHNWVWGDLLDPLFTQLNSRFLSYELIRGIPPITFILFLFIFVKILKNLKASDKIKNYAPGNNYLHAEVEKQRLILAFWLGISLFAIWLLIARIYIFSLWIPINLFFPGGNAIRAVFRFQHVLLFLFAIVMAIGIQFLIKRIQQLENKPLKASAFVFFLLIISFTILEQFNLSSIAHYSKSKQEEFLESVQPIPENAISFSLMPVLSSKKPYYELQIDAMMIANKYNLYTTNGYSGNFPNDWGKAKNIKKPDKYFENLNYWINKHDLNLRDHYFLDLRTKKWLPATKVVNRAN